MSQLLYSTKEVFENYLRGRTYKVPEYQRGYKWSTKQINQLLQDISSFELQNDDDHFYCLQNITLYPSADNADILHIVDGQQRLTTIYLLFCYLDLQDSVRDKFSYAVRKSSDCFLQMLHQNQSEFIDDIISSEDFEGFCEKLDEDFDHQDIFYMYSAIKCFHNYFSDNINHKEVFKNKFINHVKLIVNEIHSGIKEQELFMNLNTGKVPLDGADLVRAIIITKVAKEQMEYFDSNSVKDIVRINEKRTKIGWELDQLNQWWSQPKVRDYFAPFLKVEIDPLETIAFNQEINPINFLYRLWAETKIEPKQKIKLEQFERYKIKAFQLYNEILLIHRTLQDWFQHRETYHYLGFLASNERNFRFSKYYNLWNLDGQNRKNFLKSLKDEMQKVIFGKDEKYLLIEQIIDFDSENKTDWYTMDELEKMLVLLDVIQISKNKELPFLSPLHFKKNKEDKEHIYPCTPKNIKELDESADGYKSIVEYLRKTNLDEKLFPYTEEIWKSFAEAEKQKILLELENKIHGLTPINSIGNLVLLHLSINRGFGNDYYSDKRASVVFNMHEGEYVRQHTLNVFVKGRRNASDLNNWTFTDIKNNAIEISERVMNFFEIKKLENV